MEFDALGPQAGEFILDTSSLGGTDSLTNSPRWVMVDAGVVVCGEWAPSGAGGRTPAWTANIRLGKCTYPRPQVFTKGWRYEGKVHECAPAPKGAAVHASGLEFDYCLKDAERPKRWVRDLALLEGDMSPRGRFYYAQTLDLVGRKTQALAMYLERAAIVDVGFWQERVVAHMRCVPLAPTIAEAEKHAAAALTIDPTRGDVFLDVCERYEERKDWPAVYAFATRAIMTVPRADAMFARTDREARANMYAGDAASSQGKYALARTHWLRALEVGGLDDSDRLELEDAIAAGDAGAKVAAVTVTRL